MRWERRYTQTNPGGQGGSEEKKDISKEEQLDMLKKNGGDEMPDIDYEKLANMQKEATREIIKELQQPQREAERIQQVVKEEIPKVVKAEVTESMEKLKSSLKEEIKGLSKDEATELIDERMKGMIKAECEDPDSPSCLMAKQTAKAVVDEVLKTRKEEKKPFEIPKTTPEFEEVWNKMTPEERKALDLIPRKAHKTMLEILLESPDSYKGLNKEILNRLKEEEIIEIVNERPDLAVVIGKAMCGANEACKTSWNKAIEESTEIKEEEKKHFLLKSGK